MSRPPCPIPQVEDALRCYIHTRQETNRIRQILTEYLKKQVDDEQPLTYLSLTCPTPTLKAKTTSIPCDGLYKQYVEALTAHQRAQERYSAVKDEIQKLNDEYTMNQARHSGSRSSDSVTDYIYLLRQRRQHRKLEIIQDAVTRLVESESNPVHVDFKASVEEKIGEPPQAPMASLDEGDADSRVEELTFRLKKELLVSRNRLEDAKTAKSTAEAERSMECPTLQEKVGTLRKARDQLIAWVEGELAKIPEVDPDLSQVDFSSMHEEAHSAAEDISEEELALKVDDLYRRYTIARQNLIANVEATITESISPAQENTQPPNRPALGHQRTNSRASTGLPQTSPPDPDRLASKLLPYLPVLLSTQTSSATLQAQTSHLRRQLNISASETLKTIQRLAGESHLVPQDAKSMNAWAKAAKESGDTTNSFVLGQVEAGELSVARAKTVVGVLKARKDALGALEGICDGKTIRVLQR